MPIYEYRCEDCGELTERLQRFDDPPLESCPECGGPVKKLVSAPAFQFKGTGWYVTDYARSAKDTEKGVGGAESSSSSSSSEPGASETKSAGATRGNSEESPRKDSGGKGGEKGGKSAAANPT